MTNRWRVMLESLRDSFQAIAVRSLGVSHVMVERQQLEHSDADDHSEPPCFDPFDKTQGSWITALPGDPPTLRALTPEESAKAPPPSESDQYIRDRRGVAQAVRVNSVVRIGYLCGQVPSVDQFRNLAEAAGRVFRGLPPDVLAAFPTTISEVARKGRTIGRRYVFGKVDDHRPGWMGQGWNSGVAQYDEGVIVDSLETSSGSSDGEGIWLLLLHRLGWLGDNNSLILATRHLWKGGHTVAFNMAQESVPEQFKAMIDQVPKHRFYSRFGDASKRLDLCWISVWALDELLALSASAITTSNRVRHQVSVVEEAKTPKAKGQALEQLMQMLFSSVDGFAVRESNARTKTEEIDLVLDNKCDDHPWDRESSLLLVECKNWSKVAGKSEITLFENKLKNRRGRCSVGFFIAWKGFAKTVEKQLLRSSQENFMIVRLDGAKIKTAVQGGGFTELLNSAWYDAIKI